MASDDASFSDLDHYVALPRIGGLVLSPDGQRLVTTVSALNAEKTSYQSAIYELDPTGSAPARRLTWGKSGESGPAFTRDGDVLFTSKRSSPEHKGDDADPTLWQLPRVGGEARKVLSHKGGISSVAAAADGDAVIAELAMFGDTFADDTRIRDARKENKVAAILHTGYPVRFWDHDLGPDRPLLAKVSSVAGKEPTIYTAADRIPSTGGTSVLSPDGTFAIVSQEVPGAALAHRSVLVRLDLGTGAVDQLVGGERTHAISPTIAPDGLSMLYLQETFPTRDSAPRVTLHRFVFETGVSEPLVTDWDRWPSTATFVPGRAAAILTADEGGRGPLFLLDLSSPAQSPRAITDDDWCYSDIQVAPDGSRVYALRSSYLAPPHPVLIDLESGVATEIPAPAERPDLPGTLTEVHATAADGQSVRSWLCVPEAAGESAPAPLLLWVHGGPLGSWSAWSWRWCPWLMVARGYAVLLPDPALSTGYGQEFIQRGWGRWGFEPFTDVIAATDDVVQRPDIDESRTAMMGGSFGGYMANWIAGQTDRFAAIVSHASLWNLRSFNPTTDDGAYWDAENAALVETSNPADHIANIVTPMLVIHGDKDYRVPVAEGLGLWFELLMHSKNPMASDGSTPHRFLYFPNENHWILTPQHAKIWYEVVYAFLADHVLGEEPTYPEIV